MVRKDDQPVTIRKRLAIDRRAATPLLTYYQRRGVLHRINGAGHIETAFGRTVALFRRQRWLPLSPDDRAQDLGRT